MLTSSATSHFVFNMLKFVLQVAVFVNVIRAHGFLKNVEYNGVKYPAWQVGQDDYLTTVPTRYVRRIKDVGPVPGFTTKDIT